MKYRGVGNIEACKVIIRKSVNLEQCALKVVLPLLDGDYTALDTYKYTIKCPYKHIHAGYSGRIGRMQAFRLESRDFNARWSQTNE